MTDGRIWSNLEYKADRGNIHFIQFQMSTLRFCYWSFNVHLPRNAIYIQVIIVYQCICGYLYIAKETKKVSIL